MQLNTESTVGFCGDAFFERDEENDNMSDKENFKWAMRLLDAVLFCELDGVLRGEDLVRWTGLDITSCNTIISDYHKLSAIRNVK